MPSLRTVSLVALAGGLGLVGATLLGDAFDARRLEEDARRSADRAPRSARTVARLSGEMEESSGLALSRTHPGLLWTHNDSGDRPRIYGFDTTGAVVTRHEVDDAEAVDWEAMDAGPCPRGDAPRCLYLGDTGDNDLRRGVLTVWIVAEPGPDVASGHRIPLLGRIRYRYPAGERHDVEALAVHPDGTLVLVTKGRTPRILLYALEPGAVRSAAAADTTITLPAGPTLPVQPDWTLWRTVTGAAFSPAGDVLAVRTYREVFFFPWPLPDPVEEARPACFLGDLDRGEAVAFENDSTLLLTSERIDGQRGRLTRVVC